MSTFIESAFVPADGPVPWRLLLLGWQTSGAFYVKYK